ncbi:uncharacterized protein [Parasteatoda tepidariorum]|uniref:uncharacterized protein n=1 Tax=Parasteatoda tepidariorum TaxID=114398 RepID=UPI001C71E0A5|nr:uncharacterized protein LOC107446931 [Parasteatoda tepidariorum]
MNLSNWMIKWEIILLFALGFLCIESHHGHDMWHFYKMKKFMTMVAFARALGKRPTILPVPIPIPIPIAQNEIIKLPISSGGKTMVIGGGGNGANHAPGIGQILGGISSQGTGSTTYGYAQPSVSSGNINLQSLTGSDSNVVSLSSLLGNNANSNNAPKIIIIGGGHNMGNAPSGPLNQPSVIHINGQDLQNSNLGLNGMQGNNLGNRLNDLDSAYSNNFPGLYKFPPNFYSDFPRKRLPITFGGRRGNPPDVNYLRGSGLNHYPPRKENLNQMYDSNIPNNGRDLPQNSVKQRRPIPVGEKFDPLP